MQEIIPFEFIHKDYRGSIHCFYVGTKEYSILETKKGYARGGCVHGDDVEYFTILEGKIEYWMELNGKMRCVVYNKGKSSWVPRGSVHYSLALQDTVMMEWNTDVQNMVQDPLTRKKVEEINQKNLVEQEKKLLDKLENVGFDYRKTHPETFPVFKLEKEKVDPHM